MEDNFIYRSFKKGMPHVHPILAYFCEIQTI